jgi:hypothetical protein
MNSTELTQRCKSYARGQFYNSEMDKKNARLARESGVFFGEEYSSGAPG